MRATARPTSGRRAGLVVVAAGEVLVAQDRRAGDGRERDVLRREARARADDDARVQVVRVVERPLQHLHAAERAADRPEQPSDAEVAQQRAVHAHEVGDGEEREAQPVRLAAGRVDRHRARRAAAAAEQVRGDDEEAVRVERLAGADEVVPPAGPLRVAVVPGRVGVAGQGVADEDGVGAVGVELAVGLVGDLDRRQRRAGVEHERVVLGEEDDALGLDAADGAAHAVPPWRALLSGRRLTVCRASRLSASLVPGT